MASAGMMMLPPLSNPGPRPVVKLSLSTCVSHVYTDRGARQLNVLAFSGPPSLDAAPDARRKVTTSDESADTGSAVGRPRSHIQRAWSRVR
jgi:hypothetical protein